MMLPTTAELIGELMVKLIDEITVAHHRSRQPEHCRVAPIYVGSVAEGGYALVSQVVTAWGRMGFLNPIRGFVLRKETKIHGLKNAIVGFPPPALDAREKGEDIPIRVHLVDDVLTTGNSLMQLIARCVEENWMPVRIIPVVDRSVTGMRAAGLLYSLVEPVLRMDDLLT